MDHTKRDTRWSLLDDLNPGRLPDIPLLSRQPNVPGGPRVLGGSLLGSLRRVLQCHQGIAFAAERFTLILFVVKPCNVTGLGIKLDSEELVLEVPARFRANLEGRGSDFGMAGFWNEPIEFQ